MKLEIFERSTCDRVDMIRVYDFVQYVDEFNGMGSFSIKLPTNDESLVHLTEGNFIYFEEGVMGIIKGSRNSQDSDIEIEVYGYLTNYVLSQRVFNYTRKYYDTVPAISRQIVTDFFIESENGYRKIDIVTLSEDERYNPVFEDKITLQNTGDTVFNVISEMFLTHELGFEMYPVIVNYEEGKREVNLGALEFRILKPVDRTIDNPFGNVPVVFSFDLQNLSSLEYEEDSREYCNMVYVASEGTSEDRKVIEVGDTQSSGLFRIEGYVDARDLQSGSGGSSGDGSGSGSGGSSGGTVVGGAFEVAKWYLVGSESGWVKESDLYWRRFIEPSGYQATEKIISFAVNVPLEFTTSIRVSVSQYMCGRVILNNQEIFYKNTVSSSYSDLIEINLVPGVNNLVCGAWVPNVEGNTSTSKLMDVRLYDFAADINTDGYLTTTADIWRPTVDEAGVISFSKSANIEPPASRNIKGPKGDQGLSPHIDPETGHWFIGEEDTNVRADGIDGVTPHIDSVSGRWFIGSVDTGVEARGPKGEDSTVPGPPGAEGFSPTVTENAKNDEDTYKLDITTADGSFTTPNLKGRDGDLLDENGDPVALDFLPLTGGVLSTSNTYVLGVNNSAENAARVDIRFLVKGVQLMEVIAETNGNFAFWSHVAKKAIARFTNNGPWFYETSSGGFIVECPSSPYAGVRFKNNLGNLARIEVAKISESDPVRFKVLDDDGQDARADLFVVSREERRIYDSVSGGLKKILVEGEVPSKEEVPFRFGIDDSGVYGYYRNDTGEFVPFGTGGGGGSDTDPDDPVSEGVVKKFKWQVMGYYNASTIPTYNHLIFDPSKIKKIKISGTITSGSTSGGSGYYCYLSLETAPLSGSTNNKLTIGSTNGTATISETVIDLDTDIDWTKSDRTKQAYLSYDNTSRYNTNTADLDIEIETVSGEEIDLGTLFSGKGYSSYSPYNRLVILDAATLKQVQMSGTISATILNVLAVEIGGNTLRVVTTGLDPSTSSEVPIPDWTVYDAEKGMMLRLQVGAIAHSANISYNLKW